MNHFTNWMKKCVARSHEPCAAPLNWMAHYDVFYFGFKALSFSLWLNSHTQAQSVDTAENCLKRNCSSIDCILSTCAALNSKLAASLWAFSS